MGDKSAIQWTEATWNPVAGCSLVSPGCSSCYAMRDAHRLGEKLGQAKYRGLTKLVNGKPVWTGEVRLWSAALDQPLRWKTPRRIFVNSMSDLFHEGLSDDDIDGVFTVMGLASWHTFQVLTKRADRMARYTADLYAGKRRLGDWLERLGKEGIFGRLALARSFGVTPGEGAGKPPYQPFPNVWLGVSAEDQKRLDERVPFLLQCPAAARFVSVEPLLGPIDLRQYLAGSNAPPHAEAVYGILGTGGQWVGWVIVGGESGNGARPMHPDWPRAIRDQCQEAGVAYFYKQWGEWAPWEPGLPADAVRHVSARDGRSSNYPARVEASARCGDYEMRADTHPMARVGKKAAGRLLDGRTWDEFPEPRS